MHSVNNFAATPDGPLLLQPAFLDLQTCQQIRRGMDHGVDEAAEIVGDEIATRDTVRRGRSIEVDSELLAFVEGRLDGARPTIEQRIRRPLGHREGTGFLRYRTGGFYRPHRDRGKVAGWPAAERRRVTVVVFLNGCGPDTAGRDFAGGSLWLYPDTGAPVEISPTPGLLVAFPADFLHEVRPVLAGTRDAAIDWFYDPEPSEPLPDLDRI